MTCSVLVDIILQGLLGLLFVQSLLNFFFFWRVSQMLLHFHLCFFTLVFLLLYWLQRNIFSYPQYPCLRPVPSEHQIHIACLNVSYILTLNYWFTVCSRGYEAVMVLNNSDYVTSVPCKFSVWFYLEFSKIFRYFDIGKYNKSEKS